MFDTVQARPVIEKIDNHDRIIPVEKYGVKLLSIGYFVNPEDALVWRGAMATNALKQLITDGNWGELDYLLIDLPPGTSDIHLTLVQTLSVTGVVIVTTPQPVALADAVKGVSMFTGKNINVPVLGLVELSLGLRRPNCPKISISFLGRMAVVNWQRNSPFLCWVKYLLYREYAKVATMDSQLLLQVDSMMGLAFAGLAERVVAAVEHRKTPP